MEGYQSRSFDCEVGSQFHHGHVSRGPPIIPDGRISRVRFGTLAFLPSAFPLSARFKRWFAYTPTSMVGPQPRSTTCVGLSPALSPATALPMKTAKCPESLCPLPVLPPLGRRVPPPERTLLLRHRSYRLMRQTHPALPSFSDCLVRGVLAGCYQPLLPAGSSRRYLCQSFLRCLGPCHDGLQVACTCYFPCNIGLPQKGYGSAYREHPLKRLLSGRSFRSCSHFFMFRPLSLLATLVAPTTAVPCRADSGFYARAHHALLPPHAPGMLAVRNR